MDLDRLEGRLEPLDAPSDGVQSQVAAILVTAVGRKVVEIAEQVPCLPLRSLNSRHLLQSTRVVVPGPDARPHPQPSASVGGAEVNLVDGEAEIVEPSNPLSDSIALVCPDHHFAVGFFPQPLVPTGHLIAQSGVSLVQANTSRRSNVGHAAGNVLHHHDVDVMLALPIAERGINLSGLGVDHDRLDRHRVISVQNIRERAITPEATSEVELHEQTGKRRASI